MITPTVIPRMVVVNTIHHGGSSLLLKPISRPIGARIKPGIATRPFSCLIDMARKQTVSSPKNELRAIRCKSFRTRVSFPATISRSSFQHFSCTTHGAFLGGLRPDKSGPSCIPVKEHPRNQGLKRIQNFWSRNESAQQCSSNDIRGNFTIPFSISQRFCKEKKRVRKKQLKFKILGKSCNVDCDEENS